MARYDDPVQVRRAVETANALHDWPAAAGSCSEESWAIYTALQCYRAYDDWPASDLLELARLSRMTVDAVDLQERLDDEGYIILGGKSGKTPIENPASRALSTLNGSINSLRRILGLLASQQNDKRSRANRGAQQRRLTSQLTGGATDRLMDDDDDDEQFDRSRLM